MTVQAKVGFYARYAIGNKELRNFYFRCQELKQFLVKTMSNRRSTSNALHQLSSIMNEISTDIVAGLPWLDLLAELWKLARKMWAGMADEGMNEVLEFESLLELMDGKGRRPDIASVNGFAICKTTSFPIRISHGEMERFSLIIDVSQVWWMAERHTNPFSHR